MALLVASIAVVSADSEPTLRVKIGGRVVRIGLEDYVARVVAGEGQPKAAESAQQALAIAARTYGLAHRGRHRRDRYDLCDTTHCQVLRPATDASRRAARATAGRVLLQRGRPAVIYYSALCGGHSELASQVWPGADDSTSNLHVDEACRDEPMWTMDLKAGDIADALRAAGYRGRSVRDVRILERNSSGRVTRLRIDGLTPEELSGHQFRTAINTRFRSPLLRSTAFDVKWVEDRYRFTGTGYGHGVGLCVVGAGKRALQGASAEQILRFYYPSLTIGRFRNVATN